MFPNVTREKYMLRVPQYDSIQFGEAALKLRTYRQELITSNLVNADTPGFRAMDIQFGDVLKQTLNNQLGKGSVGMATTNARHIGGASANTIPVEYRTSVQPSLDGNTVDPDIERSEFLKNAFFTEATLSFLSSTIKTRISAITGQAQ
jgi:flagellar basal-body rod protein FlgB